MKFADILRWFGDLPWFDFEMVLLASGEADACVHTELYRWRQGGKLIELRRGLFVLAEPWRRAPAEPATLAEPIHPPSYLTGRWVLERRGLIVPVAATGADTGTVGEAGSGVRAGNDATTAADERATAADREQSGGAKVHGTQSRSIFTCATARPARVFENAFGVFRYDTLPRDLLFGTEALDLAGMARGGPDRFGGEGGFGGPRAWGLASGGQAAQRGAARTPSGGGGSAGTAGWGAPECRVALPEKAFLDLCFFEGGDWDEERIAALGLAPGALAPETLREFAARAGRPRLVKAVKAYARMAAR